MDYFIHAFIFGVVGGLAMGLVFSLVSVTIYKSLKLIEN